jgi:hypothetical protein
MRSLARPSSASGSVPRHARAFVVVFLATVVVSAVAGLNLWPFSSWELFSRLRTQQESGWEAVAVGPAGHDHVDPIASLPHGYRGFPFIMDSFSGDSAAQRNAICAVWLHRADHEFGPSTRALRIYRLQWQLLDRVGNRAGPPHRTLTWTCDGSDADAAS